MMEVYGCVAALLLMVHAFCRDWSPCALGLLMFCGNAQLLKWANSGVNESFTAYVWKPHDMIVLNIQPDFAMPAGSLERSRRCSVGT